MTTRDQIAALSAEQAKGALAYYATFAEQLRFLGQAAAADACETNLSAAIAAGRVHAEPVAPPRGRLLLDHRGDVAGREIDPVNAPAPPVAPRVERQSAVAKALLDLYPTETILPGEWQGEDARAILAILEEQADAIAGACALNLIAEIDAARWPERPEGE